MFFEDDGPNLRFCIEEATFFHGEDACEFIFHIGPDGVDGDTAKDTVIRMQEALCTEDFIQAYQQAAASGAIRVLFYAG